MTTTTTPTPRSTLKKETGQISPLKARTKTASDQLSEPAEELDLDCGAHKLLFKGCFCYTQRDVNRSSD